MFQQVGSKYREPSGTKQKLAVFIAIYRDLCSSLGGTLDRFNLQAFEEGADAV